MSGTSKGQLGYSIAGVIFMAIGLAVFAIRLVHAGPYALPGGAAFVGALLAIALGAYLLWPSKPRFTGLVAIVLATFAGIRRINHISASATRYMFLSELAFRHDIR